MTRPILTAIQQLLQLKPKKGVSYQEVASLLGVKRQAVVNCILLNKRLVTLDDSGRIKAAHARLVPTNEIRASGRVFWREDKFYGTWTLEFNGNPEADKLRQREWVGALGDCQQMNIVRDTPANEAALQALGLVPWSQFDFDHWPTTIHWQE